MIEKMNKVSEPGNSEFREPTKISTLIQSDAERLN